MGEIKFEQHKLFGAVIHPSRVPTGDIVIIGDYATSANSKSDFSGFAAGTIAEVDNCSHLFLIDGILDRWESRELPYQVVTFAKRYPPSILRLERLGLSQLLEDAIQVEAKRQEVNLSISWIQISNKKSAKDLRVTEFQNVFNAGRVHFVGNDFINPAFHQLTRYVGGKKQNGKADEYPDIFGYFALLLNGQL
jgi:hypothetical protein